MGRRTACGYVGVALFVAGCEKVVPTLGSFIESCGNQSFADFVECFQQVLPRGNVQALRGMFRGLDAKLRSVKGAKRNRHFECWSAWMTVFGRWAFEGSEVED